MIKGKMTSLRSPETTLKEFRAAAKEELRPLIQHWHTEMLAEHFKPSAVAKYGYQKRTVKHQKRKARMFHHQNPLEFTGELKRSVTQRIRITSTSKSATGRMRAPRYLYMYGKTGPHMHDEITAITQDEIDELSTILHDAITKRLNTAREPRELVFR